MQMKGRAPDPPILLDLFSDALFRKAISQRLLGEDGFIPEINKGNVTRSSQMPGLLLYLNLFFPERMAEKAPLRGPGRQDPIYSADHRLSVSLALVCILPEKIPEVRQ